MSDNGHLVAVIKVTGKSISDIAGRLEDIAFQLDEQPTASVREFIGGSYIVVVRPEADAPVVDWREDRGPFVKSGSVTS